MDPSLPHNKNIALIGSFSFSIDSRNSYFIKLILPYLIEDYSIDIFSLDINQNDDGNGSALSESDRINWHHLHQFPLSLLEKQYSAIIYCLENNHKSYIYRWFASHYPGIIILQDTSLFKLETGALLHGTDSTEINSLIKNRYGENAIQIGDQHILGRSLDVYGDFYPFIRDISSKSVTLIHFSPLPSYELNLSCPTHRVHRPINFGKYNDKNLSSVQKNLGETKNSLKKYFVYIESPSSKSSLEILEGISKDKIKFPILVSVNYDNDRDSIIDTTMLDVDSLRRDDLHDYEAYLLLGSRSYSGMPAIIAYAFEDNRTVSAESIGELTYLPEDSFAIHKKADSFRAIVSRIATFIISLDLNRFTESSYSAFSPKDVATNLSRIIAKYEIQSIKALERKSQARERVIQSIVDMEDSKWNYAFDLWDDTFSNQSLVTKKAAIRAVIDNL